MRIRIILAWRRWLNADDMYQKYALEIMNNVIEKRNIQWCTGMPVIYSENDVMYDIPNIIPVTFRWLMKSGYPGRGGCGIQQESTFWTRELWDCSKGYEIRSYKYAGDIILWRKFAQNAELYIINVIISGFRKHKGQKSDDLEKYKKERGKWTIFNACLKILHIPDVLIVLYAIIGGKKIIKYKDII